MLRLSRVYQRFPFLEINISMKKILITGVMSQPFGSWSVACQSNDGVEWDTPVSVFPTGITPTGIATDGIVAAISNDRGEIAVTNNMETFSVSMLSEDLRISGVAYQNGKWTVSGTKYHIQPSGSYPARSEVAQIYQGTSPYDLNLVWSHPNVDSRLYQLRWFPYAPSGIWVACGAIGNRGDAWYSIDNGFSWNQVTVPAGVERLTAVAHVEIDSQMQWYWGSNGKSYRSVDLASATWQQASIDNRDTIVDIRQSGELIVLVGTHNVYHGAGLVFDRWNRDPYSFSLVQPTIETGTTRWLIFARSQLLETTHWLTRDFSSFDAENNMVHAIACTITP